MARSQQRTALFYDAPLSTREDLALLKGMLLFFDDIVVFSTPEHPARPPAINWHLCAPLAERGLLRFVDPRGVTTPHAEVIIRSTLHRAAMENAERWLAAATGGDWDIEVPRLQGLFSRSLPIEAGQSPGSYDPGSLELFKLLAQDGWLLPDDASATEWVVMAGLPSVANSILAQAVRATAAAYGRWVEPVATRRDEAKVFTAILDNAVGDVGPSDVVASDLFGVTLDLSDVGLDDILDFRARHRREFHAYVAALHALVASGDSAGRSASLIDEANRLRELQLKRWTKLGPGVSLGIVGAAWTLASEDLLGALIAAAPAGSHLSPDGPIRVSAYTYTLRPDTELGGDG